jgi:hypothetical protein
LSSDRLVKVSIPIALTAIFGVFMIIIFFFTMPPEVTSTGDVLMSFTTIISAAALMLGSVILTIAHGKKLLDRKPDWYYSILYVIAFVTVTILGLVSVKDTNFAWIYNNITSPIGAALYSLTAFYITSAAYRVFRARNWNAATLLVVSFILLMMLLPVGAMILPPVVPIGQWLRDVPSSAGYRGMIMGTSLGVLGLGIRIFLGRQKEHLGIREEKKEAS